MVFEKCCEKILDFSSGGPRKKPFKTRSSLGKIFFKEKKSKKEIIYEFKILLLASSKKKKIRILVHKVLDINYLKNHNCSLDIPYKIFFFSYVNPLNKILKKLTSLEESFFFNPHLFVKVIPRKNYFLNLRLWFA